MHGHHTFKNISWPSVTNKQHEISSWEDVLFKRTKQNNILRTYPHEERKDDWDLKQWAFFYIANEKLFRILCLKLDEHHYSAFTAQLNPHPLVCEQYSLLHRFLRHQLWRDSYLSEKDILRTQNLIENVVSLNTSLTILQILNKMKTCLAINPCGRFISKRRKWEEMALDALSTKEKTEKFVRVVYLFSAGKWQVVFVGN